jgi:hypothetical protein
MSTGARMDSQASVVARCTRKLLCSKKHNLGLVLISWRLGISFDAALGPKGIAVKGFHFRFCCSDLKRMTPVLMKSRFSLRQSGITVFL